MKITTTAFSIFFLLTPVSALGNEAPTYEVVPYEQVEWGALNPARGDASPRAGNLWGDRQTDQATGFLVRFDEGFSSPPHIHNITYRGVVVAGSMHNDDPDAAKMWLSPSSFWTQPAGEDHITAADGRFNLAYIEIDSGPYLVQPSSEMFDNGERPVNLEASNLVWVDANDIEFLPPTSETEQENAPQTAFLWANEEVGERGQLLKLPFGFNGQIATGAGRFRSITTLGQISYQNAEMAAGLVLEPGSYFGSQGQAAHRVACQSEEGCIVYIRSNGSIRLISPGPTEIQKTHSSRVRPTGSCFGDFRTPPAPGTLHVTRPSAAGALARQSRHSASDNKAGAQQGFHSDDGRRSLPAAAQRLEQFDPARSQLPGRSRQSGTSLH